MVDAFFFFHILEEVNKPGDFFIDYDTFILYFIPFKKMKSKTEVILSLLNKTMLSGQNQENITLEGITLDSTAHHGLSITNSKNILIKNCLIKNIGMNGIIATSCTNVRIENCIFHNIFETGLGLGGGNRMKLESGNNYVFNSTFYWFGNWTRSYKPAIETSGVGTTIDHCLIYNAPHAGILFGGNYHVIKNNEIHHVILESSDAGVMYAGRDYTTRGNIFDHNYVHHCANFDSHSKKRNIMGIYNDDCLSGNIMINNFFYLVEKAIMLGGGRDFLVNNNVFVNCTPAINIDSRCATNNDMWINMVNGTLRTNFNKVWNNENTRSIYLKAYPELQVISDYYKKYDIPKIPFSGNLTYNLFFNTKNVSIDATSKANGTILNIGNYFLVNESDFVDFKHNDFTISKRAKVPGYKFVDMKTIGLLLPEEKTNVLSNGAIAGIVITLIIVFSALIAIVIFNDEIKTILQKQNISIIFKSIK